MSSSFKFFKFAFWLWGCSLLPCISNDGKTEKCQIIQGWYAEVLKLGGPGVKEIERGPTLQDRLAPAFLDQVFINYFGKSFFSLSIREKSIIKETLLKCFPDEPFLTDFLIAPFLVSKAERERNTFYIQWANILSYWNEMGGSPLKATNTKMDKHCERVVVCNAKEILSRKNYRAFLEYGNLHVILLDPNTPLDESLIKLSEQELIPAIQTASDRSNSGEIRFYFETHAFETFSNDNSQRDSSTHDVRHFTVTSNLQIEYEVPVLKLSFIRRGSGPYQVEATYFDKLALDPMPLYNGDPSLNSLARILAFVADPTAKSAALAEQLRIWKEQRLQIVREKEEQQQKELQAARSAQRRDAAEVLTLMKNLPITPKAYDFSGYRNSDLLIALYTGNFAVFVGDHSPNQGLSLAAKTASGLGAMIGGNRRAEARATEGAADIMDLARRRVPLKLALLAYHETFAKLGQKVDPSTWIELNLRFDYVERNQFGTETTRIPGKTQPRPVRRPYAEVYEEAITFAQDPGFLANLAVKGGLNAYTNGLREDFERLMRSEGCDAPVVRTLEVNLYLAYRWFLPSQQLRL